MRNNTSDTRAFVTKQCSLVLQGVLGQHAPDIVRNARGYLDRVYNPRHVPTLITRTEIYPECVRVMGVPVKQNKKWHVPMLHVWRRR